MSKVIDRALSTIEVLGSKSDATIREKVLVANAAFKVANRTLPQIYNILVNAPKDVKPYVLKVLGTSKFPKYADFAAKAPKRESYSIYSGLQTLAKFNVPVQLAKKVERQNNRAAKLSGTETPKAA